MWVTAGLKMFLLVIVLGAVFCAYLVEIWLKLLIAAALHYSVEHESIVFGSVTAELGPFGYILGVIMWLL